MIDRNHDFSSHALLVLCFGLMCDDGMPANDLSRDSMSKMKKSALCIAAEYFQAEITCSWEVTICTKKPESELKSHAPPPPSQLTIGKIQLWLLVLDNPVSDVNNCALMLIRRLMWLQRLMWRGTTQQCQNCSTKIGWGKHQYSNSYTL